MDRRQRFSSGGSAAVMVLLTLAFLSPPSAAWAESVDTRVSSGVTAAADGGDDTSGSDLVTFGMTTASDGKPDDRGFISVSAPPGAVLHDNVAVFNLSNVPLDVNVYATDAGNTDDGGVAMAARTDTPKLAGAWLSLDAASASLSPQSSTGPGLQVVPVTITIPQDAEPGDHVAAIATSITAAGQPGENAPGVNLEQRVGVRVYVKVQGLIRPGLTITGVEVHFRSGGPFAAGTLRVEYTLTNSGNVRYGVVPAVRGAGPFGLGSHSVDGAKIDELLPHSSVRQSVDLPGVFPLLLENVAVSATAIAALGNDDPGIGTVRASAWTWLWSWLVFVVLLVVVAVIVTVTIRRRRRRPGVWGPPEATRSSRGGPGAPEPPEPGRTIPEPPAQHAPAPEHVS